ncbi:Glutamyl-tRNA amidotransferase B subunit [Pisolithus marmoratus]|nr:Glutamyl-tRNA amidotransferase B subunit [Pisolithus marmoratus]
MNLVPPRWPGWEVVVGIEVHAQIKSRKKTAKTIHTNEPPNTSVSYFDAALPGNAARERALNPKCVELAVRTALALNAHVQRPLFYPDLPSGYQITQRYAPLARGGFLRLSRDDVAVRITQLQLEHDTAKSTFHAGRRVSLIDLNRAGTGLMEIVSEPDMREAGDYVRTLQTLLRAVGSSDGSMELGSLRCDVNVSVNRHGRPPGTRCEIKNLNSIKFMMTAITSEAFRHIELLESGRNVAQETRGFDEDKAETFKLRSKEDSPDYKYMPDPNLPPLLLSEEYIERVRSSMPELPSETRVRLLSMGLSERDVDVLMTIDAGREVWNLTEKLERAPFAYFTDLIVVNWYLLSLLLGFAKRELLATILVSGHNMGELIDMVQSGKVTGESLDSPSKLAKQLGLVALSQDDSSLVNDWCLEAIKELPQQAEAVRKGNLPVLNNLGKS